MKAGPPKPTLRHGPDTWPRKRAPTFLRRNARPECMAEESARLRERVQFIDDRRCRSRRFCRIAPTQPRAIIGASARRTPPPPRELAIQFRQVAEMPDSKITAGPFAPRSIRCNAGRRSRSFALAVDSAADRPPFPRLDKSLQQARGAVPIANANNRIASRTHDFTALSCGITETSLARLLCCTPLPFPEVG